VALFKRPELPRPPGKIQNLLGANTRYTGTLNSDENLRIDGIYQGHIETAGNVIIGPTAKVLADVTASAVQVWGAVRGNITAAKSLEILSGGRVWGDVRVNSLSIDEGGIFRGQCIMGGERMEPLMLPPTTDESSKGAGTTLPDAGEDQTGDDASDDALPEGAS